MSFQESSNSEAVSRMVVAREWGWGVRRNGELVFNGHRLSSGEDEKVLKLDIGDGCTTV